MQNVQTKEKKRLDSSGAVGWTKKEYEIWVFSSSFFEITKNQIYQQKKNSDSKTIYDASLNF